MSLSGNTLFAEALVAAPPPSDSVLARQRLIEAMIAVNQKHLRCEAARGGAEIERACVVRDAGLPGASPDLVAAIESHDRRLAELDEELRRLSARRDWLATQLAEVDGTDPAGAEHTGHA